MGQLTQYMLYAPDRSTSQKDPDLQVELPPQSEAVSLTLRTAVPTHGQRMPHESYEEDLMQETLHALYGLCEPYTDGVAATQ